jgi:hypothetical protein
VDTGKNSYSRHSLKPRPSHRPKVITRGASQTPEAPFTQVEVSEDSVLPVVTTVVTDHAGEADPHPQYATSAEVAAAIGAASVWHPVMAFDGTTWQVVVDADGTAVMAEG